MSIRRTDFRHSTIVAREKVCFCRSCLYFLFEEFKLLTKQNFEGIVEIQYNRNGWLVKICVVDHEINLKTN